MKAGTIARIVDYGIMAVIILALIIPAVVTVYENDISDIGAGIPAVYEKDELNAETLEDNIMTATDGQPGYRLSYGGECVDIVQSDIKLICAEAMLSTADTITVLTPDGEVARQQGIVYSNNAYMLQKTGFMAPGLDKMPVLMNMALGLTDPQGKTVFKGNSETVADENGIFISFYTPLLPYVAASAAGYSTTVTTGADMTGIFQMDLDLGLPTLDEIPFKFTSALGITTLTFDTQMAGNSEGSIGDVKILSTSLTGLSLTYTGVLSEKLDAMAEEGPVDIRMGDKTYTMTPEDAHGLADIFKVLEDRS